MGGRRGPARGRAAAGVEGGRIVVSDVAACARLFAPPPAVTAETRRLVLYAIAAPGVPSIAVEEALLVAWDIVRLIDSASARRHEAVGAPPRRGASHADVMSSPQAVPGAT